MKYLWIIQGPLVDISGGFMDRKCTKNMKKKSNFSINFFEESFFTVTLSLRKLLSVFPVRIMIEENGCSQLANMILYEFYHYKQLH